MKRSNRPAGAPRRAERRRLREGLVGAWIRHPAWWAAAAAVVLYAPALGFGFVRDDHTLIENNPFLTREGFLGRLLGSDFFAAAGGSSGLWRPFVVLSFWLQGRAFGWDPVGFHAVNLVAHAAVSAGVALVTLQSGLPRLAALAAGLWFAMMPAHHESVAWISGRTDVFCALFFLSAFWLDRRARHSGRRWPGVAPPLLLGLALTSKETALPFVALVALADWIEQRPLPDQARWLSSYLAVTVLYLIAHRSWVGDGAPLVLGVETIEGRRLAGWAMLPEFLGVLMPWYPHSPDRAIQLPTGLTAPVFLGLVLQVITVAVLVTLSFRRSMLAVPLFLFWSTLAIPIAAAIVFGFQGFAERMIYLPSAGAAWLVAGILGRVAARGRVAGFTIALFGAGGLLASAVATVRTVPIWQSDSTMYRSMVERDPNNAKGHIGWAEALIAEGRMEEALTALEKAETIDASLAEPHISRASIHFRQGSWQEAVVGAEQALSLAPGRPEAERILVAALLRLRRVEEAVVVLTRMRSSRPDDPAVHALWGQALLLMGRTAEALQALHAASQWIHDDPSLWFALGNAAMTEGRYALARHAFEQTVVLDSLYYEGWLRLAAAAHAEGDRETRDRGLLRAAELPEAKDGRTERVRASFGTPMVP